MIDKPDEAKRFYYTDAVASIETCDKLNALVDRVNWLLTENNRSIRDVMKNIMVVNTSEHQAMKNEIRELKS